MNLSTHRKTLAILATCLVLSTAAAPALSADPAPLSGQFICKIVDEHKRPVEGDPAHQLISLKALCDTQANGDAMPFDGGKMTMMELDDLVRGNGTIRGYDFIRYKDGSTQADTYVGQQLTKIVDGRQEWSAIGTWDMTRGTGRLANAQFRGWWTGRSTSATDFIIEWSGFLTPSERK